VTLAGGEPYAPGVIANRQTRVAASGGVVLALAGLFVGHTLEYLRVWGSAGIVASMTNPVHAYMLPVAGVLVAVSAMCAYRLARAWRALNQRLDRAAAGVRRIWHGDGHELGAAALPSTPGTRLVAIWLPLAAVQIALYLVQENVEAVARSQPAPGLGAITGIHWAAPFVHLYVSLLLACGVRICQILFRRRVAAIELVEALLRAIAGRRRVAAAAMASPVARDVSPLDRIGLHLWRRPPPLLLGF
jgi:hypothetical protein